jgi:hypothetical protein
MCTPKRKTNGAAGETNATVHRTGDDRYYLVNINGNYCQNIKGEHKTNGVYFVIGQTGLRQKCFCRCDTTAGRINGKCSDFKSETVMLPDDVAELLFSRDNDVTQNYADFLQRESQSLTNIKNESTLIDLLFERKLQQLANSSQITPKQPQPPKSRKKGVKTTKKTSKNQSGPPSVIMHL